MIVVDPEVTRRKLERELELWRENEDVYRRRGWLMLRQDGLEVDVGFLGRFPLGPQTITAMPACIRLDFANYDVWPPSVDFIDPFTGDYAAPPVQALIDSDEGPRDLVVHSHPETNRPFFCVPGVRQYHDHPQHSGDSWLLHRASGEGTLATICERVWRTMARNLVGLHLQVQTLPGQQIQFQLAVANAPGEVAPTMWAQAEQAQRAAQAGLVLPQGVPLRPEALAALGLAAPGVGPAQPQDPQAGAA